MRARNCIFDLYGTLADIRTDEGSPALWQAMAERLSAQGAAWEPEELHQAYLESVHRAEQSLQPGDALEGYPEIDILPVFRSLYECRGVRPASSAVKQTAVFFRRQSTSLLQLYPGARHLLTELRRAGRGVWLLSNAQSVFTRMELRELGIADCFDGICLSSDCGVKKPDLRFFETALSRWDIPRQSAVMIGNDARCDIEGARTAGLSTLYIRSEISPLEPLPSADAVLPEPDMDRLLELLLQTPC